MARDATATFLGVLMKTLGTIIRAFILGAIAGILVAPRPGRETRDMIRERWNELLESTPGMNFDDTSSTGGPASA